MPQTLRRRIVSDFGFYIVVLFIAIAAWESQSYMYSAGERRILTEMGASLGRSSTTVAGCKHNSSTPTWK